MIVKAQKWLKQHAHYITDAISMVGLLAWLCTLSYQKGYLLLPMLLDYHITAPIAFMTVLLYRLLQAHDRKAHLKAIAKSHRLWLLCGTSLCAILVRFAILPLLGTALIPIGILLIAEKIIMAGLFIAACQLLFYPPDPNNTRVLDATVTDLSFLMTKMMDPLYVFDILCFVLGPSYHPLLMSLEALCLLTYYPIVCMARPTIDLKTTLLTPLMHVLASPSTYAISAVIMGISFCSALPLSTCIYLVVLTKHLYAMGLNSWHNPIAASRDLLTLLNAYLYPAMLFTPRYITKQPTCILFASAVGVQLYDHDMASDTAIESGCQNNA